MKGMTKVASVSTQQISFALFGLRGAGPQCAGDIERSLMPLDGIVVARVNCATERVLVVYDPARVTAWKMVNAIRSIGFDTPVDQLTLHSDDLLYATSARTVERAQENTEGVVHASVDLAAKSVIVDVVPEYARWSSPPSLLGKLGFRVIAEGSAKAGLLFGVRCLVLIAAGLFAVWGAGAHAGMFAAPPSLHAPLVVMAIALTALVGAGLPFFSLAYAAALLGEFDAGVIVALLASAFALGSLPLGLFSPNPWLTNIGLVIATTLTAGWFIVRGLTLWVFPRRRGATRGPSPAAATPAPWGVVSDGSHQ